MIKLLDAAHKLYSSILSSTLKVISDDLMDEEQMSFKKRRSTCVAIFVLYEIMDKFKGFLQQTASTDSQAQLGLTN